VRGQRDVLELQISRSGGVGSTKRFWSAAPLSRRDFSASAKATSSTFGSVSTPKRDPTQNPIYCVGMKLKTRAESGRDRRRRGPAK
jgi:hypothetical protein